ncbi:MAG: hypothetical protein R2762_06470 [Bryobacteraceae bacterium]
MLRILALSLLALLPAAAQLKPVMVGHEFRQDDFPTIAAAPDGSMWTAWLSWDGSRDDVGLRRFADGEWSNIHWVPNTSGDSWMPQVAADSKSRVWVVWSQQVKNNWDLFARRFDPAAQEWGPLVQLTNDPMPDIHPRMVSDGKGAMAVVWQGYRGKNSNIFAKTLEGETWSADVRVTNRAANDWEPAVAMASNGDLWVAYDSYKNGNYDVYLSRVSAGRVSGEEIGVATSARFEARATVAVDTAGRVWVAWEEGQPNWGKDQGYILRARPVGVQLGGVRRPRVRCYDNGQWRDPAGSLATVFKGGQNTYQPHIFSDGKGSVWLTAKTRVNPEVQPRPGRPPSRRGYWEYYVTHYADGGWITASLIPESGGRSSTRMSGALDRDGSLWMAWDKDTRAQGYAHRATQQHVYAGKLPAAVAQSGIKWGAAPSDEVKVADGHPDETGDLRAIHAYRVNIGGRQHQIVRGDFHRHTELSWDGGGATDGSLEDFYRYMIDAASMDFGASTDHQGGAWPYWWWYTLKMTDMHHVPGTYVPIYGYERSAVYPNGHRNMFFVNRSDAKVTPFHLREGVKAFALGRNAMGDEPGVGTGDLVENDTKLLYEEIRNRNALAISHTSGTRMGTDWRDNDPDLEPVVEIFQGARSSYEQLGFPYVVKEGRDDEHMAVAGYQPAGMVNNAWAKGYKLGIITSSDHGSTHISYALVYTSDYSRQGILDAIRKRHTYGATDNIVMDVRMGNYFMGDEFATKRQLPIKVKARGTKAVARVDIIKDNQVIYTAEPKTQNVGFEYTDKASAAGKHFYYVRLMQDDGMIAWSSPFFINYP